MKKSTLELQFEAQLRQAGITGYVTEYRFDPVRKWRFDFAWPGIKVAAECEGGIWSNGAHSRGKHFNEDCEKYNTANLAGWHVYRFTERHLNNNTAIKTIHAALQARSMGFIVEDEG